MYNLSNYSEMKIGTFVYFLHENNILIKDQTGFRNSKVNLPVKKVTTRLFVLFVVVVVMNIKSLFYKI